MESGLWQIGLPLALPEETFTFAQEPGVDLVEFNFITVPQPILTQ